MSSVTVRSGPLSKLGSVFPYSKVHALESKNLALHSLGSSFNFEDRIGAGVKIGDTQRVGIRAIHYPNAGIKEPNDGIESYALFYSHSI
jgi:lipid A 3-O-deacylase